jgi:hypothetical protein
MRDENEIDFGTDGIHLPGTILFKRNVAKAVAIALAPLFPELLIDPIPNDLSDRMLLFWLSRDNDETRARIIHGLIEETKKYHLHFVDRYQRQCHADSMVYVMTSNYCSRLFRQDFLLLVEVSHQMHFGIAVEDGQA